MAEALVHVTVKLDDGELLESDLSLVRGQTVKSIVKRFTHGDGREGMMKIEFMPPLEIPAKAGE